LRIRLPSSASKTAYRDVDLTVAPQALPPRAGKDGPIFPATTIDQVRYAFERLRKRDPLLASANVSAHALRRTCATFFTCAFNPWRSAKSLGHSVVIAERHYASLVHVTPGSTTLAQAMGVEDLLAAPTSTKSRKPRSDRGAQRCTMQPKGL
jgi:integrase